MPEVEGSALIRVTGIGGGGSNAVDRMIDEGIGSVEFIAMNTDGQALMRSQAPQRIRLGDKATRGAGPPEVIPKSAKGPPTRVWTSYIACCKAPIWSL